MILRLGTLEKCCLEFTVKRWEKTLPNENRISELEEFYRPRPSSPTYFISMNNVYLGVARNPDIGPGKLHCDPVRRDLCVRFNNVDEKEKPRVVFKENNTSVSYP